MMGAQGPAVQDGDRANSGETYDNVPCPFCGLLCDDLKISRTSANLEVVKNGCPKAVAGFQRQLGSARPQIAGKDATLNEAVAAAASMISKARLPVYGGLGTDVDGMRSVMALADRTGGVVGHAYSESQYRNYRVLQTGGWVTTTLTEARNRADLFVIAGHVHAQHPRFFERIVCPEKSMFPAAAQKRTIIFLGDDSERAALTGPRIGDIVTIPVSGERIGELVNAMRAMTKGAVIPGDTIAGVPASSVQELLARIRQAAYGVFVYAPPAFTFENADLAVQSVAEFVKELNLTQRFASLSLGGSEGAVTAGSVCAWQTGFPLRVSFASGKPEYDPERFALMRLIEHREADLLMWIASYSPELSPPKTDIPMIVLGTPGLKYEGTPAVYIPVGTPGVDHAGLLIRCDSVVTLPLKNLRRTSLPSAGEIVARIEAAL